MRLELLGNFGIDLSIRSHGDKLLKFQCGRGGGGERATRENEKFDIDENRVDFFFLIAPTESR